MTTRQAADMVASLRAEDEDFEWYPTTAEMVAAIIADAKRLDFGVDSEVDSVLDIGAGDARVLGMFRDAWRTRTSYSIEKSSVLQAAQPEWVVPAGADFHEQDLMAVQATVVFCNPPYSDFEAWTARIIAEAFCRVLYLIIPQRWVDSPAIKHALASRGVAAHVVKSTDFLRADRSARARVDILRIEFAPRYRGWGRTETPDPFDVWFSANVSSLDEEQGGVDETVDEARLVRLRDASKTTGNLESSCRILLSGPASRGGVICIRQWSRPGRLGSPTLRAALTERVALVVQMLRVGTSQPLAPVPGNCLT